MSMGRCPVCNEPKERRTHLVCPHCWVKVPEADQQAVYDHYQKRRGSDAHRRCCFSIIRRLYEARRAEKAAKIKQTP